MSDSRLPKLIYVFLLACGAIGALHFYPLLPERMASHFSANGMPNGWQTKDAFFALTALVCGVTAVIGFLAPRLIAAKPASKINLPNKSYWLAPEHRTATMEYIAAAMNWFGCAVLFVLLAAGHLAIRANLAGAGKFDSGAMSLVLLGFFAFIALWLIRFIRHFRRVP